MNIEIKFCLCKKQTIKDKQNIPAYAKPNFTKANGAYPFNVQCLKMIRYTLKILRQMLQNFQSVSDLFWDIIY